jgi:UDP-N-acetylmuramoyl-tripeptide--D-alanyl-D-alanine ligase
VYVMNISREFAGPKVTYGIDHEADFRATEVRQRGLLGSTFKLNGRSYELSLPGRHNLENLLAAIATARTLGISWESIARGVGEVKPAYHRGIVVPYRGAFLYDDTYNSNPYALRSALQLLKEADVTGRRIAVIGDMLELGEQELQFHRDNGKDMPREVDVVIGVGPRSKALLEGAAGAGFSSSALHHFDDAEGAGAFLETFIREGDLVLIKASRGIGLDRIVTKLEKAV